MLTNQRGEIVPVSNGIYATFSEKMRVAKLVCCIPWLPTNSMATCSADTCICAAGIEALNMRLIWDLDAQNANNRDDDRVIGITGIVVFQNVAAPVARLKWSQSDLALPYQTMESLDAGYALLRDVNAQNRELQARLRSSLPLLWTNNALVMTSAAPRRRRRATAEQSVASEADQMLLALEGQSSLQVSRRYRRRMEWEVARRIARVDRELQQYPPALRFWNQRRKESTPPQSAAYRDRKRVNEVGGVETRGAAEKSERVIEKRKAAITAGRATSENTIGKQQERKFWMTSKVATETGNETRQREKHVSVSPFRGGVVVTEDKENKKPNAVTRTRFGEKLKTSDVKESPVLKDTTVVNKEVSEPCDVLPVSDEEMKKSKPEDLSGVLGETSNEASSQPEETESDNIRQARSSLADDIFTKEKATVPSSSVHQDGVDDDMFAIEENSLRRTKTPAEERPSSSIGRQVLSDFRTMPSVATFGAQPILSGGMGDMRLNGDVLRRLFSDLDTDKDGHVNRIETCMALHRLQISVSTTKIISFFRHIHSSDAKGSRSRHIQSLPMKEVINYKEFVAFVTAAYDQQQQQKMQHRRASTRRKVWKEEKDMASPLSVPSTSLPIYAKPSRSPKGRRSVRASLPLSREEEIRVYEVNDAGEAEIEDRVIQEIPNFLVSRILADTPSAANVETKEKAESVVRRSLESLVGKEAVDDKIVNEITQELIRERLRNIGSLNQDDTDDITGLKRAAAYYNEQVMRGDADSCSIVEDSSSGDLINWVDVLTEEQVSGLVQQIWKDKQAGLRHVSLAPVENIHIEDLTEMQECTSVRWIDQATDTNELSVPAALSEKAVQVFDEDTQEKSANTPKQILDVAPAENNKVPAVSSPEMSAIPDAACLSRTHLGRALSNSLRSAENDNGSHELFSPVTSIGILQQLRRQRRMHENKLNKQPHKDDVVKRNSDPNVSVRGEDTHVTHIDLLDRGSLFSFEEEIDSVSTGSVDQDHRLNQKPEMRNPVLLPTTKPVPLTQKMLELDDSVGNESNLDVATSISMSSSGLSSTSDYHHLYGISCEIDRHQLHARSQFTRRRRRQRRCVSVSGSSVPDSICSAELSEGELSRDEALDLSDGEIFGECKKEFVRHKNKILSVVKREGDDDNLHSSVKSEELPALMKAHANFRHQLVAQSVSSSIESGELEDGSIPN